MQRTQSRDVLVGEERADVRGDRFGSGVSGIKRTVGNSADHRRYHSRAQYTQPGLNRNALRTKLCAINLPFDKFQDTS